MNQALSPQFEKQKNIQAAVYTGIITVVIMLIIIYKQINTPVVPPAPMAEFLEINLGSGDEGMGDDQPELPGDPAPAQQIAYQAPQAPDATDDQSEDVTSENEEDDAPAVVRPAVSKTDARKVNTVVKNRNTNTTAQPVNNPAPPKPKAVLGRTVGGNGNGGNGAESYRPGSNQGIAGGTGDQGRPGGSPTGTSYTGTPKNFGVRIMSIPNQTFEDDFNQNAKVAMDIVVNESGKVTSASFQPRGSTTSDRKYIDIARRSAFELKMGATQGGQKGTVVFNFKVRG